MLELPLVIDATFDSLVPPMVWGFLKSSTRGDSDDEKRLSPDMCKHYEGIKFNELL